MRTISESDNSLHTKENGSIKIIRVDTNEVLASTRNKVVNSSSTIKASALVGGPSAQYISAVRLGFVDFETVPVVLEIETGLVNPIAEIPVGYDIDPRPFFEDDSELKSLASTVTWTAIIPADDEYTFDEAGLFSDQGIMWSRATFSRIVKPVGVAMALLWKMEF